jgi:hypothetical protein
MVFLALPLGIVNCHAHDSLRCCLPMDDQTDEQTEPTVEENAGPLLQNHFATSEPFMVKSRSRLSIAESLAFSGGRPPARTDGCLYAEL